MSLTAQEMARTSNELKANFALTGLTVEQVATDLGCPPAHVEAMLNLADIADPADVWQLRDYLETAVRDTGNQPVPFAILTEGGRRKARMWFHLRPAPRHDFTAA